MDKPNSGLCHVGIFATLQARASLHRNGQAMTSPPEQRTLKLHLLVVEFVSAESDHSSDAPFRETLAFETRIDHDYYFRRDIAYKSPHAFENKDIRLEIHSDISQEFLLTAQQKYGVPNACGAINFVVADDSASFEFIDVNLALSGENFDKLWRHTLLTVEGRFLARIELTLAGISLPEPQGRPLLAETFGSVDLADLPIAKQSHIIRDFSLIHTSKAVIERHRKRAEVFFS